MSIEGIEDHALGACCEDPAEKAALCAVHATNELVYRQVKCARTRRRGARTV